MVSFRIHAEYSLSGTPCLSFDIIPDNLGNSRETFPHTCYMVCGTQAERTNHNGLIVMKVILHVVLILLITW